MGKEMEGRPYRKPSPKTTLRDSKPPYTTPSSHLTRFATYIFLRWLPISKRLDHNNRVKLVGGEDRDAVLVTGRQTFTLTRAETSNTLLLLPPEGSGTGGSVRDAAKVAATGTREGFQAVAAVGFQYEARFTVGTHTPSRAMVTAAALFGAHC